MAIKRMGGLGLGLGCARWVLLTITEGHCHCYYPAGFSILTQYSHSILHSGERQTILMLRPLQEEKQNSLLCTPIISIHPSLWREKRNSLFIYSNNINPYSNLGRETKLTLHLLQQSILRSGDRQTIFMFLSIL